MKKISKVIGQLQPMLGEQGLKSVIGTRLIRFEGLKDILFQAVEARVEREPSVMIWSYITEGDLITVEIDFNDESNILKVVLNPNKLTELQQAIDVIDHYFIAKRIRS